jgi:phosphoglycerate dehydrogenase-like enzyme
MNPQQPRVLVCDPIHDDGVALLRQHATVDIRPGLSRAELEEAVGDADALIVRSATKVPASVIARGHRLRVIGRAGAGLDTIDVQAARVQGIEVVNAPDANTVAVAEHTIGLMLTLARRLVAADQSMKAGRWEKSRLMGTGLMGKTLGIVGFGRIGRQVARYAQAFGMRVLVNQPRLTPELALEWGVEQADLTILLREADFVTLHVPMRAETNGMIGASELSLMKPTAYIINTARGGVIDEASLLAALDAGKLAGAALDVFTQEPAMDSQLATHPRVLATPHIAASTEDAQRSAAMVVAEQIVAIIRPRRVADTLALRVVPLNLVVPHETFDAQRAADLAERLVGENMLINPPVVAERDGRYVVLDGATRTAAMKQLGLPHTIVQVVPSEVANQHAHVWFHAISGAGVEELLGLLRGVPGLELAELAPEQLRDRLQIEQALAGLLTADKRAFLLRAAPDATHDWLDVLNPTVERYTAWGTVERTLATDLAALKAQFPELVGLVLFPQLTADSILGLAAAGRVLPAGVTRFVVPGRILRLNMPLDFLRDAAPLAAKSEQLDAILQEKLAGRRIRYYQEPVVLLDE